MTICRIKDSDGTSHDCKGLYGYTVNSPIHYFVILFLQNALYCTNFITWTPHISRLLTELTVIRFFMSSKYINPSAFTGAGAGAGADILTLQYMAFHS
jgi:hypothetical protein